MRLTLEEQRILRDLAESSISVVRRGRKSANHEQERLQRQENYKRVGDLINRYEAYLATQE